MADSRLPNISGSTSPNISEAEIFWEKKNLWKVSALAYMCNRERERDRERAREREQERESERKRTRVYALTLEPLV